MPYGRFDRAQRLLEIFGGFQGALVLRGGFSEGAEGRDQLGFFNYFIIPGKFLGSLDEPQKSRRS
jgi:hypothetical protein